MGRIALTLNKAEKRNLSLIEFHHWTTGQNLHILIPQMHIIMVGQETLSYEFSLMQYQTIVLPSTWQKQTLVISRGRHFHCGPQGLCTNDLSLSVSSLFEDHQTSESKTPFVSASWNRQLEGVPQLQLFEWLDKKSKQLC